MNRVSLVSQIVSNVQFGLASVNQAREGDGASGSRRETGKRRGEREQRLYSINYICTKLLQIERRV